MKQTYISRYMRQASMVILLLVLVILVIKELYIFLPGFLGAITAYIVSRNSYFQLVYHRKWRKGWTAGLYLLVFFVLPAILIYFGFSMLGHQLRPMLSDPAVFLEKMRDAIAVMERKAGIQVAPDDILSGIQKKIANL